MNLTLTEIITTAAARQGITRRALADALGLTMPTLLVRLNNPNTWRVGELLSLQARLGITINITAEL